LHASPLGRARETADLVAHHAGLAAAELDDRLQEHGLGQWEGLAWDDIEAGWPDRLEGTTAHDWFFRAPDAESLAAARQRAQSWLDTANGPLVVVTHRLISRMSRGLYAGLDEAATLSLPIPQDVIWHLRDRKIEAIRA
jgi:probable phosphoglycerate mutase